MRLELERSFHMVGYYDPGNSLNWVFDVGNRTVELQQGPPGAPLANMRIRLYRRELKPLPPKPYMWLGAEAEAT